MEKLTTRDIQSIKTQKNIKECANSLFVTKDYDKVKVSDICKCACVSVGAFYHYYNSKEDIINDTYNDFDVYLEEEIKNRRFDSSIDAIKFLLYFEVKSIVDRGYIFTTCYFKNQLTNKERNIINKGRFFYKQLLSEVTEGIKSGDIKYDNGEKFTDFLLRTTRGSIYNWCLHGGNYDLVAQTTEDINFILDSVR